MDKIRPLKTPDPKEETEKGWIILYSYMYDNHSHHAWDHPLTVYPTKEAAEMVIPTLNASKFKYDFWAEEAEVETKTTRTIKRLNPEW